MKVTTRAGGKEVTIGTDHCGHFYTVDDGVTCWYPQGADKAWQVFGGLIQLHRINARVRASEVAVDEDIDVIDE